MKLFAALAITTLRNDVGHGESNLFGGIFFVRADDTSVNTVTDLKGKIIAASSILLMGSGQTQWQEMRKYGLDLLLDPAQVCVASLATPLPLSSSPTHSLPFFLTSPSLARFTSSSLMPQSQSFVLKGTYGPPSPHSPPSPTTIPLAGRLRRL